MISRVENMLGIDLPPHRHEAVADIIHRDPTNFMVGCGFTLLACIITAFETRTGIVWSISVALGVITIIRVISVNAYHSASLRGRLDENGWLRLYSVTGLFHAAIIGIWPLGVFLGPDNAASRLFSFATALCFLIGLIARNYNMPKLVQAQLTIAAIPMTAALIVPGDIYHTAFALFFGVFFLILLKIASQMRATFQDVVDATDRNWRLAFTDGLTRLPNRSWMKSRLETEIGSLKPTFALHFIDLDRFQRINDAYGHGFGDQVLGEIARRVRSLCHEKCIVARFADDEFIVLQSDVSRRSEAASFINILKAEINRQMVIDDVSVTIECSIGTAMFPRDGRSLDPLLQRADTALHASKIAGRGRHSFFEKAMEKAEIDRMHVETDLREAILDEQFTFVYQPIINVQTRNIDRCEALIRWDHPIKGRLLPGVFLPIAEESGLMGAIFRMSLEKSFEAATKWPSDVNVSVNVSPREFERSDIVSIIIDSARKAQLPLNRIDLEITENILVHTTPNVLDRLKLLREHGVCISLDDFGTGYSNLSNISQLPIDRVKIDKAFIGRAMKDKRDLALLRGMIRLIRSLNFPIVVEGVEEEDQLEWLATEEIVEEVQGFLFGQPVEETALLTIFHGGTDDSSRSEQTIPSFIAGPFSAIDS